MSSPIPGTDGRNPSAERGASRDPGGEPTRGQRTADWAAEQARHAGENREAQLGGADAVEGTTYVVGQGTEPDGRPTAPYVARDAAGGGTMLVWVVGGLAALIAAVYVIGIFV
jgi:hypothetical protein